MDEQVRRESPLHASLVGPGADAGRSRDGSLRLREIRARVYWALRGRPDDCRLREACEAALGTLPRQPNTVTRLSASSGARGPGPEVGRIVWLRPTEWLIVLPHDPDDPASRDDLARVRAALSGGGAGVVDLSAGLTTIEMLGAGASDLLASGCPLDLHPAVFGARSSARSVFGKAEVIVLRALAGNGLEILVRRSHAPYVWQRLCDAL